jgi:hypothetical protein
MMLTRMIRPHMFNRLYIEILHLKFESVGETSPLQSQAQNHRSVGEWSATLTLGLLLACPSTGLRTQPLQVVSAIADYVNKPYSNSNS